MKKTLLTLVCLLAMMATGIGLKAQEVKVTLNPGWTWFSGPVSESLTLGEAFVSFTPMNGDVVKSQAASTRYVNGNWIGQLKALDPGIGYQYYSKRTEAVTVVLGGASAMKVTTSEPTNINCFAAICGGTVVADAEDPVLMKGICWATHENPTTRKDSHIEDEAGAGSFSFAITDLTPETVYYVRAYAVSVKDGLRYGEQMSFTTPAVGDGHAYVDLGLPSGLLWATCNIGADAPEDCGDYFAWGETTTKSIYDWSTYQYCEGSSNTITKYCQNPNYGSNGFTDDLTTLLPEDDAATANWGDGWRMPTLEDFQELRMNTTVTWTNQNGVNGCLFTANNGNTLFLPAAGFRDDSDLNGLDGYGYYWSSSLDTDRSGYSGYAWYFILNPDYYDVYSYARYCGYSVRPVRSSGQNTTTYVIDATANPTEGGTIAGGGTYEQGQTCTLTATANTGYTFANWTENDEVVSTDATYTFTVTGDRTLVANFTQNGGDDHAYVDLGLPSGLLWATCNVGATTPEGYGAYNTVAKYCSNSSYGYNGFTDDLTTLLPEDDAATANRDDGWRMPTQAEWQELLDNTTVTWTTQNGVNGRLFTASNGNTLFLPAAGYLYGGDFIDVGSRGYYWSSSLLDGFPEEAWYFYFDSDDYYMYYDPGYRGQSVRAVRSTAALPSYTISATVYPTEGGTIVGGGTYEQGQTCTLTATANAGYTFANWTENGEVVFTESTYTFTVTADRSLIANFAANPAFDHDYVDLGLPSGLLWATCNIGAENPEDYGDYFAWGETEPKDYYDWSTYQYCNGSYNTMTKYCNRSSFGYNGFTDNLTTLQPSDDVATANWGDGWRMPTRAELQELLDNTTMTMTTQNGVNGRLFTASNGNSLFLPSAGYRINSSLYDAGSRGYYWSSSLDTDIAYRAWRLYFRSGKYDMDGYERYYGRPVRPVRSARQN